MNDNAFSPRVAMAAFVAWIALNILLAGVLAACILQSEPEGIASALVMLALVNTLAFLLRRSRGKSTPVPARGPMQKIAGYFFFGAGMFCWKFFFDGANTLATSILFAAISTALYIAAELLIGHWKRSSAGGASA